MELLEAIKGYGDSQVTAKGVKPFFSYAREPKMIYNEETGLKTQLMIDGALQYENIEKIKIVVIGDRTLEVFRTVTDEDRKRFAHEYRLWKDGEDYTSTGTPLPELHGVTASQIDILQHWHVTSIEELAELDETRARDLGNRITHARQLAINWVQKTRDGAGESAMADELLALREQMKALTERADQDRRRADGLESAMEAMGLMGEDDEDDEPAPRVRSKKKAPAKRGGRKKAVGHSVEAMNPNAVAYGENVSAAPSDDDNPFAEGIGDPVEDIIGA